MGARAGLSADQRAFGIRGNRIAMRFAYEWHDDSRNWFRSHGNENWEFEENGLMRLRFPSINDLPIKETERKYHWPLWRRLDDHPGLSDLGIWSCAPEGITSMSGVRPYVRSMLSFYGY
jgi:nuclear transport factor 2 (NTF2) superfamily protein